MSALNGKRIAILVANEFEDLDRNILVKTLI